MSTEKASAFWLFILNFYRSFVRYPTSVIDHKYVHVPDNQGAKTTMQVSTITNIIYKLFLQSRLFSHISKLSTSVPSSKTLPSRLSGVLHGTLSVYSLASISPLSHNRFSLPTPRFWPIDHNGPPNTLPKPPSLGSSHLSHINRNLRPEDNQEHAQHQCLWKIRRRARVPLWNLFALAVKRRRCGAK